MGQRSPHNYCQPHLVNNLLKGVQSAIKLALQNELESNQKLYLLHHRLEINH